MDFLMASTTVVTTVTAVATTYFAWSKHRASKQRAADSASPSSLRNKWASPNMTKRSAVEGGASEAQPSAISDEPFLSDGYVTDLSTRLELNERRDDEIELRFKDEENGI